MAVVSTICIVGAPLSAQQTLESSGLQKDLAFLASELPAKHPGLFSKLSKPAWKEAVSKLKARIAEVPLMTTAQWQLEVSRLLAGLGDSHTAVKLDTPAFRYLPINFKSLSDGVFIRAIEKGEESSLKAKVLKIGSSSMESISQKLSLLFACDNQAARDRLIDDQLNTYDLLVAMGVVAEGDPVLITILKNKAEKQLRMAPLRFSEARKVNWSTTTQGPDFGRRDRLDFWNDYRPQHKLLHFKYNRCRDARGFSKLVQGTAGFIAQTPVEKMVVDLRDNSGGDSSVFEPLLRYLESNGELNRKGKLYVIVGRSTYSSAIMNAIQLKEKTAATLVGEPTSGRPNHFGEVQQMRLPYSGTNLFYSTRYFQLLKDSDPDSLVPELNPRLNSVDWFAGKDTFMEAILRD